jgi:hypothetical protein
VKKTKRKKKKQDKTGVNGTVLCAQTAQVEGQVHKVGLPIQRLVNLCGTRRQIGPVREETETEKSERQREKE